MASLNYNYVRGPRVYVSWPVKASTTIESGAMVDTDASGYLQECDAGDIPVGFAVGEVPTGATATSDGDILIQVDVSRESVYRLPPDAGSATLALQGKTADVGGAKSVDIDASTDDVLYIVEVDVANNLLLVQRYGGNAGVV